MNKLKWLIVLCFLNNVLASEPGKRIVVKLPFNDREEILSGMRKYLKITERMLREISTKNYSEVERLISKIEMDKDRLYRISKRENLSFMELAYRFHSVEVQNIKNAAKEKNQDKLILAISNFIGSCNHCHDRYQLIEWGGKDYPAAIPNKKFIDKYINLYKK